MSSPEKFDLWFATSPWTFEIELPCREAWNAALSSARSETRDIPVGFIELLQELVELRPNTPIRIAPTAQNVLIELMREKLGPIKPIDPSRYEEKALYAVPESVAQPHGPVGERFMRHHYGASGYVAVDKESLTTADDRRAQQVAYPGIDKRWTPQRELAEARRQILMDTECIERIRKAAYETESRNVTLSEENAALKRDLNELADLREEAMKVIGDAKRYRWLVDQMTHERSGSHYGWTLGRVYDGDDPESAIDRARAEEKKMADLSRYDGRIPEPAYPTAHDHGNCELCDWQEARIAALLVEKEADVLAERERNGK